MPPSSAKPASRFDIAADLVVVGLGAAGAASAIAAADLGASVIVLEKQAMTSHKPNTMLSSGFVASISDLEAATRYFDRCSTGLIPTEVTVAWLQQATSIVGWLEDVVGLAMVRIGGPEHPEFEGADAVSAWGAADVYAKSATHGLHPSAALTSPSAGGKRLFQALQAAVAGRANISCLYEHTGSELMHDTDGSIIVQANTPHGPVKIKGSKGVVLACGGFDQNPNMQRQFLRGAPIYFYGSGANDGSGVQMAQGLGADLWHMPYMLGRAVAHFDLDDRSLTFPVALEPGGYVLTDKYGARFVDETLQASFRHDFYNELVVFDSSKSEYPRIPCYWFFDSRRFEEPLVVDLSDAPTSQYKWSADNQPELVRGWLYSANTVENVASMAGLADPSHAACTVVSYNETCDVGYDSFGRASDSLIPLSGPPFFCMRLWPGGPNTTGGPRRNERSQVIDVRGNAIPRLYAAGELGECLGELFPVNGANISDGLCFGQIAAEHAIRSGG